MAPNRENIQDDRNFSTLVLAGHKGLRRTLTVLPFRGSVRQQYTARLSNRKVSRA